MTYQVELYNVSMYRKCRPRSNGHSKSSYDVTEFWAEHEEGGREVERLVSYDRNIIRASAHSIRSKIKINPLTTSKIHFVLSSFTSFYFKAVNP